MHYEHIQALRMEENEKRALFASQGKNCKSCLHSYLFIFSLQCHKKPPRPINPLAICHRWEDKG